MSWKGKKIAIIGDVMLDRYIDGVVTRISPEAPVPILEKRGERYVSGGAANVAANVSSLRGAAFLYGIIGQDNYGNILKQKLESLSIDVSGLLVDSERPTTVKTRFVAHGQQMLRLDEESTERASDVTANKIISQLEKSRPDVIICSDYAKGVITQQIIDKTLHFAAKRGITLIADPKPSNRVSYDNVYLITPNRKEAGEMAGFMLNSDTDITRAGKSLVDKLNSNILITLGEQGMVLFEQGKREYHVPAVAREVSDVSGAGDTVIATIGLALSSGIPLREAVNLANKAAGVKVGKAGTSPVRYEELFE